jgi:predicted nuclease of predicted toxin-antitoxin system
VTRSLLLDEHFSPRLAALLGDRGVTALPVVGHPDLSGAADHVVLTWATRRGFVLVTEDGHDFMVLHNLALADRRTPAGLALTSPRRFPRTKNGMGVLADALKDLVLGGRAPEPGGVVWL